MQFWRALSQSKAGICHVFVASSVHFSYCRIKHAGNMQPEGCRASLHLSTGIIITDTHIMSRLFLIFFFFFFAKTLV